MPDRDRSRHPFLRLVFAGTPEFAARALAALLDAGHEIALVLTQPDRPAGRGMRPAPSAVKKLCMERGLEVFQPEHLKSVDALERLQSLQAEALIVAAYGLLLPSGVLKAARRGALNIHASLLPRWRGAAPIQRALLAGDAETGITIMQMDAGLDTGPMLSQRRIAIATDDDAGTLHDKLAALGAEGILEALSAVAAGSVQPSPQPEAGVSYARKIAPDEAVVDWTHSCVQVERKLRALRPGLGARSSLLGEAIKLWRGTCVDRRGEPGAVLEVRDHGILIACGEGALLVSELQRAGGKRLSAADFLRGFPIKVGERIGAPR